MQTYLFHVINFHLLCIGQICPQVKDIKKADAVAKALLLWATDRGATSWCHLWVLYTYLEGKIVIILNFDLQFNETNSDWMRFMYFSIQFNVDSNLWQQRIVMDRPVVFSSLSLNSTKTTSPFGTWTGKTYSKARLMDHLTQMEGFGRRTLQVDT